jgi:hypothetical protein
MIECGCGCGVKFERADDRGRPRSFLPGHQWRGRRRPEKTKPYGESSATTAREMARRRKGNRSRCELAHIGGCGGRIEVAHLDHDPWNNNDPANLKALCASHHKLYDNGRIDLSNPQMPAFYVSSGKRRYHY